MSVVERVANPGPETEETVYVAEFLNRDVWEISLTEFEDREEATEYVRKGLENPRSNRMSGRVIRLKRTVTDVFARTTQPRMIK